MHDVVVFSKEQQAPLAEGEVAKRDAKQLQKLKDEPAITLEEYKALSPHEKSVFGRDPITMPNLFGDAFQSSSID